MAAPAHTYSKGQSVWYKDRSGVWLPAKVEAVDLTVRPVSYGIALEEGRYRETESPRLSAAPPARAQLQPSAQVPALPDAAELEPGFGDDDEEDDFGDFSGAADAQAGGSGGPAAAAQPDAQERTEDWRATALRPHTAAAAFSSTAKQQTQQAQRQGGRHTARGAFQQPLGAGGAGGFDDDFGDFEAAEQQEAEPAPAPEPAWGVQRGGPLSLSLFSEEEEPGTPAGPAADAFAGLPADAGTWGVPASEPLGARQAVQSSRAFAPELANGYNDSLAQPQVSPVTTAAGAVPPAALGPLGLGAHDSWAPKPARLTAPALGLHAPQAAGPLQPGGPGSGALSPMAGGSDDFGDFEEAAAGEQAPSAPQAAALAGPLHSLAAAGLGQPAAAGPAAEAEAEPEEETREGVAAWGLGAGGVLGQPGKAPSWGAPTWLAAAEPPAPEGQSDGEVPWYLDPASLQQQQQQPEPEREAAALPAASAAEAQLQLQLQQQRQEQEQEQPDSGAAGLLAGGALVPAGEALLFQSQPQQLQGKRLAEALPGSGGPPTARLAGGEAALLPPLPAAAPGDAPAELGGQGRDGYVAVWTALMQACAAELEQGQAVLRAAAASPRPEAFLRSTRGRDFVAALAQLFLAAQILEAAMRAHVSAAARPPAFEDSLRRCSLAWQDGDPGLAIAAGPLARQRSLELPQSAAAAVAQHGRWQRLRAAQAPAWQDGLCGLTLLPLEQLAGLHAAPWVDGRPCLVMLANLWTHRVRPEAPSLLFWQ